MKYRITRVWREVEADGLQAAIEATASGDLEADELHLRPTQLEPRDPHSFAPGDPVIEVPRRLATGLLERMEMARDHIEHATGATDDWGAAAHRAADVAADGRSVVIPEPEITWAQVKNGLAAAEQDFKNCKWWQLRRRHRALNRVEGYRILVRAFEAKPDRQNL